MGKPLLPQIIGDVRMERKVYKRIRHSLGDTTAELSEQIEVEEITF